MKDEKLLKLEGAVVDNDGSVHEFRAYSKDENISIEDMKDIERALALVKKLNSEKN